MTAFKTLLGERFRPGSPSLHDAVYRLRIPTETLADFTVTAGELRLRGSALAGGDQPEQQADVTFTFDGVETAQDVLFGHGDPIAAFMAGRFRSDGHLPLTFVLLGFFREEFAVEPPA